MPTEHSKQTRYEARTSKRLVHIFDSFELAQGWMKKMQEDQPAMAKQLQIYKVTITTTIETLMEAA